MTSVIEYSKINKKNISDLGTVTLKQGIKFKKYQSKIAKSVESKNLLFEGFEGSRLGLELGVVYRSCAWLIVWL